MIFGPMPVAEAAGTLLAHSVKAGSRTFKKGRLLSEADIDALSNAGVAEIIVVRLETGEVGEDEAAEGSASIVNITSIAGVRPVGSSVAYAMTMAALNHMTVLLAKSYGPIRVNAVAPGLVATPWTDDWDAMHAGVAAMAPIPRSATPDDCAEATLALIRNKYATGEIFVVDGGLTQKM